MEIESNVFIKTGVFLLFALQYFPNQMDLCNETIIRLIRLNNRLHDSWLN